LQVGGVAVSTSSGAALTGSTNNTITTVTGANAIQGEANLTFDGSTLGVTGDIDLVTTGKRIDFDTDNDTSIRASADDNLVVESGGSDLWEFDSVNGGLESNFSVVISSSGDTDGPGGTALLFVCRDNSNGGGAAVLYTNTQTPIILGSTGGATTFVTGAPSATQIQVKNRGAGSGVAFLGGSSRDGMAVGWSCVLL
jgi:hypothetical protein